MCRLPLSPVLCLPCPCPMSPLTLDLPTQPHHHDTVSPLSTSSSSPPSSFTARPRCLHLLEAPRPCLALGRRYAWAKEKGGCARGGGGRGGAVALATARSRSPAGGERDNGGTLMQKKGARGGGGGEGWSVTLRIRVLTEGAPPPSPAVRARASLARPKCADAAARSSTPESRVPSDRPSREQGEMRSHAGTCHTRDTAGTLLRLQLHYPRLTHPSSKRTKVGHREDTGCSGRGAYSPQQL